MKGNILAFAPYYGRNIPEETVSKRLRQSDLDQLVRIPGVKEEVSRIAKIKPTDVFLDRRATETNFKHAAANYTILHLAMHTILDDNDPLYSKLAFTQNVDTVNDGFLHTYEIYNMKLNANLAVLSSCGSGYGDFKEGEGIQSLARGFAYAGCPSVLMTLWEVADKSTVGVMERFYFHLGKGLSKSKALQKSKLEFLEQADQLRSNPFFWASYTIIGNSEPIYPSNKWNLLMTIFLLLIPVPVVMILYRNYKKQGQKNI
jgi:CHAT domain-containing protein